MSILYFFLSLGILFSAAKGIQLFNLRCRRRFGHRFFTAGGFWQAAIAINFLWWGYYFWVSATLRHAPTTGGFILMAMGIAVAVWMICENVKDTDLMHGIGGSSLQVAVFFPVALYGIPLLVVAMLFLIFSTYRGAPAWLINP